MDSNKNIKNKNDQLIWRILILLFSFYLIAVLFSESFWGFHFFATAPTSANVLTLLCILGIFALGSQKKYLNWFLDLQLNGVSKAIVLSVILGFLFHQFSFVNDAYGDALRHKSFLPDVVEELDEERTSKAYTLNVFQPKIGEITLLNAVEIISYETGTKVTEVFRWIGTIFGILFVFYWVLFTNKYFEKGRLSNVILLLGIFSPFVQLFFGHVEIYAPAITFTAITLMCLLLFIKEQRKLWGIVMLVCLFLAMKFHFVSVLMIPACALAWLLHWKEVRISKWITWRRMWLFVMIPVIFIGIAAYIFVFKDYNDPRFLNGQIDTSERLFLPVFSPEAPLDRYNLLSWNHLWDYFNMFFLWSVSGIFILVVAIARRGQVLWKHQGLVLITMTLLFYVGLFFMVNPLVSMPMDFDLFSLPAPVFVIFAALLLSQFKEEEFTVKMVIPILALSMITIPIVATNQSVEGASKRLEYLGRHTFKTYWIRSVETLRVGLEMDPENYEKRLLSNINKLKPYAIKGKDKEYANLLWRAGKLYRKSGQAQEALKWHSLSQEYFSGLDYNQVGLVESYYLLGQYENALEESRELIKMKYPSKEKALNIAFDCAVQAKDATAIIAFGKRLQKLYPDNPYYSDTMRTFQNNQ